MSSFSRELKSLANLKLHKFWFGIDDERIKSHVCDSISCVINFGQSMPETKLSGDDYTFVFLRNHPKKQKSGAFRYARWMVKAWNQQILKKTSK